MTQIKSVQLALENCETIEIGKEDIGKFYVSDIKRSISRRAVNSISDSLSAEEVCIQISSKANCHKSFISTWHDGEVKPFDRLMKHDDITALCINYQDGKSEHIYVNWGGDSEYNNDYQSIAVNENTGDLYLVISKKKNVGDYFKEDLIEEETYVWELYSDY